MNTGILYIVATPIGNLEDMTFRAVRILKEADLIFCEDTRITKRLLDKYEIGTPVFTIYHYMVKKGARKPIIKFEQILRELENGKNIALVTDAGTPGISDPGSQLVEVPVKNNIKVVPIPGASALTALASVSGIDLSEFIYLGFPPHKKGRETFFKKVVASEVPVIYYESPHRLIKNLELLSEIATSPTAPRNDKRIILGRELTKMFEEIVRGKVDEVLEYFKNNQDKARGEITVIVH
jgi:16S rRNA (cytidine1402-2'-O)-methyltransferase